MLNRINELARKKRSVGLNAEELAEQKKLYEEYLLSIRGQMINLLLTQMQTVKKKLKIQKKMKNHRRKRFFNRHIL